MKGKERKNREERHDIEQDAKRAIIENTSDGEEGGEGVENGLEDIPVVPSDQNNTNKARVIFILEKGIFGSCKSWKGLLIILELFFSYVCCKRRNFLVLLCVEGLFYGF